MKFKQLTALTLTLAMSQSLFANPVKSIDNPIVDMNINTKNIKIKRNTKGIRELDMTNSTHYNLVKSRLNRANRNIKDYPQLHQTLELQKQQQILKQLNPAKPQEIKSAQPDLIENAHLFLDFNVAVSQDNGVPYLILRAKSSVHGGTLQTYIDILPENEQGEQLASMGSTFNVMDGKDSIAISTISLEALKMQNPDLEAIYVSSYVETEALDGTITSALKYTEYPFTWDHIEQAYPDAFKALSKPTAPVDKPQTAALVETTHLYANQHANSHNSFPHHNYPYYSGAPTIKAGSTLSKVCLNRKYNDCDHNPDQYLEPHLSTNVTIPMRGQVTVPHEIITIYPTGLQPQELTLSTNVYSATG